MPWPKVEGCPEFTNVNWVHPLFQKRVSALIDYTKDNYPYVKKIVVFGSAVTNRCTSWSDVDLCIFGDYDLKFIPPLDGTRYDVLWAQHLTPDCDIWRKIEKEGVLVYG